MYVRQKQLKGKIAGSGISVLMTQENAIVLCLSFVKIASRKGILVVLLEKRIYLEILKI